LAAGKLSYAKHEVRCRVTLASIINLRNITKATLFIKQEIKNQKKPAFTGNVLFLFHFMNDIVSANPAVLIE
jgi:hypothetical protein